MAILKPFELLNALIDNKQRYAAALVHGADRGAVRDLCQKSAKRIIKNDDFDLSVSHFNEAQILSYPEKLFDEFLTLPMFGNRQVIWVSEVSDSFLKPLAPVVHDGRVGNFLLFDADALSKTSKLRKFCETEKNVASVALYEESTHEFRNRIESEIASSKQEIDGEALERLLDLLSTDRAISDSEVNKLLTYCLGQKTISIEDVEAICGDTSEAPIDALLDAIFEGDMASVDHLTAIFGASSSRSMLSLALQHSVKLQTLLHEVASGMSPETIVAHPRNAIFFKRRPAIIRQLRRWSLEAVIEAEDKINLAILQTRQTPELENAIASRTLLALSRLARS